MLGYNNLLDLETRRRIYNYISKYPGLHFRRLCKELKIPNGTMSYHLSYLKKRGLIEIKNKDMKSRYFVSHKVSEIDKKLFSIFRKELLRNILIFTARNYWTTQDMLAKRLKKSNATISRCLNKLIELDIIESIKIGSCIRYRHKHPEQHIDFLIRYRKNFLDNKIVKYLDFDENNLTKLYSKHIESIEEILLEILPHPYHV
jgi:predicted transcriptional regulator